LSKEGGPETVDGLKDAETTYSYVPQRNLIFTAYAFALAEQLGLGRVALGMNLSDGGAYPDNGVPFLYKMDEIVPYSSNWNTRLMLTAPLVNLMKQELIEVGLKIGVPFEYVCSCYYPELKEGRPYHCAKCGSDVHYEYAWRVLGYRPPSLGFDVSDLAEPCVEDSSPGRRLDLYQIPYQAVIRETL